MIVACALTSVVLLAISAAVIVKAKKRSLENADASANEVKCIECDDDKILREWLQMKMNGRFRRIEVANACFVENCIKIWHKPFEYLDLHCSILKMDNHFEGLLVQCRENSSFLHACLDFCRYGDLYIDIDRSISVFYNDVDRIVLLEKGTTLEQMLVELDMKKSLE